MTDDRPGWARRMTREREARSWSQTEAIRAMRAHSRDPLPEDSSLLRQWKRWETGEHVPSDFYQPLIAVTSSISIACPIPPATHMDSMP